MELIKRKITLDKTIVVKKGDRIVGCEIHVPRSVDPAIYIPMETVESGDYEIRDNVIILERSQNEPR